MKKELSMKSKTLISWALFITIFAVLVVIASFYDLAISKMLTKNSLADGAYIASNGYGLFFEAMGSAPIFVMISLGAAVWFWWGIQHGKKWLSVIAAVGIFAGFFLTVNDAFKYVLEAMSASANAGIPTDGGFRDMVYIPIIAATISAALSVLLIFAWKNVKPETNNALFKWMFVILGIVVCYLIVNFVKGPVGRMRFRAMNAIGDTNYDNFTGWWVTNGKRAPYDYLPSDQCKSFPSGHTYSAAVIYSIICLPDLIKSWDKKWVRALLWTIAIVFTGAVAISRIVIGAHYMSDVLFAGTISFLAMMIFREIIILKGAHFKAVFCKRKMQTEDHGAVESEQPVEITEETAEKSKTGDVETSDENVCECPICEGEIKQENSEYSELDDVEIKEEK